MENQLCSGNDDGEVDRCGRRRSDGGCEEAVQNVSLDEFSRLIFETQPKKRHMGESSQHRQIHGVPPQLRQQMGSVYDPEMVSLGPYHHGKPELGLAEEFKYVCLDWCARGNEEKKGFLYNKVLERIDEIRSSYAEVTIVDKYDDKALALMMLLDACFIVNFMDSGMGKKENNIIDWLDCLGLAASIPFMTRDIMLIENQLPFFVIKLLMSLLYIERETEEILGWFFSRMTKVDLNEQATVPVTAGGNEQLPIHLLEACWRVLVLQTPYVAPSQHVPDQLLEKSNFFFAGRSVMDLKAKGIRVGPSSSQSLKNIVFKSSASYGQLQLPVRRISQQSHVIWSNLIAFEVSPSTKTEPVVLSYIKLMKSLIQSPEDVKELQEKGVLLNTFVNYEQVVQVFKEINTYGITSFDSFKDVKQGIEEHCRNKAKTWVADLIHTRFQTPWAIVAFFAATLLLCLTFLQTFFTIRPVN